MVNVDAVSLALLELVLHVEVRDPLRVQIVHDHLRLADLVPHSGLFLVEDGHGIGTRERIEVWEREAGKIESDHLDDTLILFEPLVE